MLKDLVVSTAVIVGECSCDFDIDAIYTHLEITDTIVKLKCNNKEKSKSKEIDCKTFYNQISFSLSNKANIKLFNNGKFQVSGVKNVEQARENLEYILYLIEDIKGFTKIKPAFYKGLAIYKNKIITKKQDIYMCSNLIKDNKIIIKGETCDIFEYSKNTYIQDVHVDKRKKLYNSNCEEVGYVDYIMTRKNKNLCLKGSIYKKTEEGEYTITNKYKNDIGIMKIHVYGDTTDKVFAKEIELVYAACSETPKIIDIRVANMNSNTKFILEKGCFLDRDMICEYLSENNINFVYDPCRYAGIKFKYADAKITIFRTGSILFSSNDPGVGYYEYIKNMFSENNFIRHKIEKKTDDNLTIWDL